MSELIKDFCDVLEETEKNLRMVREIASKLVQSTDATQSEGSERVAGKAGNVEDLKKVFDDIFNEKRT